MTAPPTPAALARLAAWPERHAGLAFLTLILLAVVGTVFGTRLPLGRFAPGATARLQVQANLSGIDAATAEDIVTLPLERALRGLWGAGELESRTRTGRAIVNLSFGSRKQRDGALEEARRTVLASTELPAGMDAPVVEARDAEPAAVVYAIESSEESSVAEQWVERALAAPLRELPEVAAATIEGALEREILVEPDARRLAALGLSFDDLIQALRRPDQAPLARRKSHRPMVAAGSAESIATRAVRLPSGEPIALAEVARISAIERADSERPYYGDVPVLRLAVYVRRGVEARRVAERADAHLAWLRANDLVPPEIAVHVLEDESRVARRWLRRAGQGSAIFLAVTLLAVALVFGVRRASFAAAAFAVWLPSALAAAWVLGFTLNTISAAGFFLAAGLFPCLILGWRFLRFAAAGAVIAAGAWLIGEWLPEYRAFADVLALSLAVAIAIAWLLRPWMHRGEHPPSLVRALSRRRNVPAEGLGVFLSAAVVLFAAAASVRGMATVGNPNEGTFVLRVSGRDAAPLSSLGERWWSSLAAIPAVENVSLSTAAEETWRLQLDPQRMDELGLRIADVGRALSIAREGLVVGEIAYADTFYRIRLRLPAGTAGDAFERLLLRGERPGARAVYLRDVGIALREMQPRERLRIDGRPAVEIGAHWRGPEARAALERFCSTVPLAGDFKSDCRIVGVESQEDARPES